MRSCQLLFDVRARSGVATTHKIYDYKIKNVTAAGYSTRRRSRVVIVGCASVMRRLLFVDNVDTVQHVYDTIRTAIHEYGGAATRTTCVRAAGTL